MGKTRTKVIDLSQPEEEKKPVKKKLGRLDDQLVEKLRKELGIEEEAAKKEVKDKLAISEKDTKESQQSVILGSEATPESNEQKDSGQARMTQIKKPQKPGKTKPRSKKYQEMVKDLDRTKTYPVDEAVEMVKKLSYSKFNGTLEAHINTYSANLRGLVSLPYASGKKLKILAFGKGAQESGSDIVGDDSTLESISQGKVDFDLLITTPEWMPKLAKVAKVLGPKGLMPNLKNGTITDDLKKGVESFQSGKTEYKTEPKAPIIHLALGKLDQPTTELSQNIKTLLATLGKTKIKKVTLSPTMGPSIKLDLASL